jgi:hypothetical protein
VRYVIYIYMYIYICVVSRVRAKIQRKEEEYLGAFVKVCLIITQFCSRDVCRIRREYAIEEMLRVDVCLARL